VITPRATRLVRAPDLQAFREAVVRLSLDGPPLAARDRLVVVPTRAAASLLVAAIEDRPSAPAGAILPDLATPRELTSRLGERAGLRVALGEAEREALLGAACRAAAALGTDPPFRIRPGLLAEILRFYDDLRRRRNTVDEFERRTLGLLEPGAATDRGAERLVRQTTFLAAAYRDFERRTAGRDEHGVREALLATSVPRPYRHVVVAVADEAFEAGGLRPTDWDLLARVPGLERLDLVVTDEILAGPFHERVHRVLPGIEEVRAPEPPSPRPVLVVPRGGAGSVLVARDREEEVAAFARRLKAAAREGAAPPLGRVAFVVRRRLPYVYLARDVLRAAGVPSQTFDALPLAAEPFAAALDLVLSAVSANFARTPAVALLRSPHFRLAEAADIASLDRELAEAGYLGEITPLERALEQWRAGARADRLRRALRAGERLLEVARRLAPLREPASIAEHLGRLIAFVTDHEAPPPEEEALRAAHLRARGAVLGTLVALRAAHARVDAMPADIDTVAALVRRWIEGQTFAPRVGSAGVYVIDSDSARFGRFEEVHLAGVVEGEWPERPRRNVFYSPGVLRELGWPSEADRLSGARAAFADLLRLPASRVSVSTFALEDDAPAGPSALVDEIARAELEPSEEPATAHRVFDHEALSRDPVDVSPLDAVAREWATRRLGRSDPAHPAFHGFTASPGSRARARSALERYQDCPFRFFATDVLRLEEDAEDDWALSPRVRGRFVHELLQRFFEAWDARGGGRITPDRLDGARALMAEVAGPLLERLPASEAALERLRIFGSAIATGMADAVLEHEVDLPDEVQGRWLERRLDGAFTLGDPAGRRVELRGVADRIDLLAGRRLRVIDYKSGRAPDPRRAFQAATYALCAREILQAEDGAPWSIEEVGYLALAGPRTYAGVTLAAGTDGEDGLAGARARLRATVEGIEGGRFPPRPYDTAICDTCPYASVCRKDYVRD
jgi:RecB family exonuclease